MYILQGKPDQHVTRIPRSVYVWSQIIRISRNQCIATFHVVPRGRSRPLHPKEILATKNRPTQPSSWVTPFFLPHDNLRIGKGDFGQVVTQLHHLTSPIYQHMIGTFNTCPREPTHRSLIDIGGGYNLRDVSFLHHTPRPSQSIVLRFHLRAPPGLRLSNLNINL
jgi:hypothetical protein